MNINFDFDGGTLCKNEHEIAFSLLYNYHKDKEFKTDIDNFFSDFNGKNNSSIGFTDIVDIHRGDVGNLDTSKVKLLNKALEEFKNNSNMSLKFNDGNKLNFNLTTGVIKSVNNDVSRVINGEFDQIKELVTNFILSIQQKLALILKATDIDDSIEDETVVILDEENREGSDEIQFSENKAIEKEEKTNEEKFIDIFINEKERGIRLLLNLSYSNKKQFFNFLHSRILHKGLNLSNATVKNSVLSNYLGGEGNNNVRQVIYKLYAQENYTFRRAFIEKIYDKVVLLLDGDGELIFTSFKIEESKEKKETTNKVGEFDTDFLNDFLNECKDLNVDELVVKLRSLTKFQCAPFLKGFVEYYRKIDNDLSTKDASALTEIFAGTKDYNTKIFKNTYGKFYTIFKGNGRMSLDFLNNNIDLFLSYIKQLDINTLEEKTSTIEIDKDPIPENTDKIVISDAKIEDDINSKQLQNEQIVVENKLAVKKKKVNQKLEFERMQNLKGFVEYINKVIITLGLEKFGERWHEVRRNALLAEGNFTGNACTVSVDMLDEINEKALKSDRFRTIFTIIPEGKFPIFIEFFLKGNDECSEKQINRIMSDDTLRVEESVETKEEVIIPILEKTPKSINTTVKDKDVFTYGDATYLRNDFPFKEIDDERWFAFISDCKSGDFDPGYYIKLIIDSVKKKQVGSDIKRKNKSRFGKN